MSVGVSQDLSEVLALWYFLTSFITSPGKLFAVVKSGALKLDENICSESKNLEWEVAVFLFNSFVPFENTDRTNH